MIKRDLEGHSHTILALSFLKDDAGLVSGSCDSIRIWDPNTGVALHALTTLPSIVSVSVSTTTSLIAAGCGDGSTQIVDVTNGTLVKEIANETSPVNALTFTPNGKSLVTGNWNGTLSVWDVSKVGGQPSTAVGEVSTIKSINVANVSKVALVVASPRLTLI